MISFGLTGPHHDGSALYVPERPGELGDEIPVFVRIPRSLGIDRVALRYVRDGEPRGVQATLDRSSGADDWWRAQLSVWNPTVSYRFIMSGRDGAYLWLNAAGVFARDVVDADDFVITLSAGGPDWHRQGVVYEVFPDRFAKSGVVDGLELPGWAQRRAWGVPPTGRGPETPFEVYGGDLPGIQARLDYLERLGISVLYLTPFFPAASSHRYDASSFERVDPLLGGDRALAELSEAAHRRGLRVIGDLTLNHCGALHEWFTAAQADPSAPERDLFYFDDALPNGYESWLGIPTLPKLDWSSPELRRRMTAAARLWLEPPFELDGWRIDVANMVGRFRELALTTDVAAELRTVVADKLLVAEHGHDFRADLLGDGWHGTMNYAGFLRPVWTWLRAHDVPAELQQSFWGVPVGLPRLGGRATAETMASFRAGLPWDRVLHSWSLLDSHDTARFRTVAGSRDRHLVGIGLQMTSPGVPMVFAGDEVGLEGDWGEDARRTMPWDDEGTWDRRLHDEYRSLIALRRAHAALADGGLRYVHVDDDAIAFLRESPNGRVLCLASRASHPPVTIDRDLLGTEALEPLVGGEAAVDGTTFTLPSDGPAFHAWALD
ncbi:MAG: glycoside hydrolase family 13 protein [Gaiellales bacterium]